MEADEEYDVEPVVTTVHDVVVIPGYFSSGEEDQGAHTQHQNFFADQQPASHQRAGRAQPNSNRNMAQAHVVRQYGPAGAALKGSVASSSKAYTPQYLSNSN